MKLEGKTILVTGANRGIGLALVHEALKLGATTVYATYRSDNNRNALDSLHSRVVPVQLELSDHASVADSYHNMALVLEAQERPTLALDKSF